MIVVVHLRLFVLLAGVVLGLGYMSQEAERAAEHLEDLSQAVEDSGKALRDTQKDAQAVAELGKAFDELKNKSILTTEEQKKFVDIQNQLKDLMPQISGYYDDQGNFVMNLANNQQTLNAIQREAIEIKKQQLALDAEALMNESSGGLQPMLDDLKLKKETAANLHQDAFIDPDSWKITQADADVKKADLAIIKKLLKTKLKQLKII